MKVADAPPAGWYPDPTGGNRLRWWDGLDWTGNRRSLPTAAKARLTGIKDAQADNRVLTVEYLSALERIGDGRATKLVIPAEFSGLLGTVTALAEAVRSDDDDDELRPRGGLPVPDTDDRVDLAPPSTGDRR